MTDQKDTYSIVVLGGMNPRIHHPSWYRLVGLFDEEEAEQATKTPNTLITPPLAQIQTPKLTIVCQDDRWEIRTTDTAQVDRIKEITVKLFDDFLPHTPLAAAGFNFNYWKPTNARKLGNFLASTLIRSPLGLKPDNAVSGEVVLRRQYDDHTASVLLRAGVDEQQTLLLAFNFDYRFEQEGEFKLGSMFAQKYGVDRSDAEQQTAHILEAINRAARD